MSEIINEDYAIWAQDPYNQGKLKVLTRLANERLNEKNECELLVVFEEPSPEPKWINEHYFNKAESAEYFNKLRKEMQKNQEREKHLHREQEGKKQKRVEESPANEFEQKPLKNKKNDAAIKIGFDSARLLLESWRNNPKLLEEMCAGRYGKEQRGCRRVAEESAKKTQKNKTAKQQGFSNRRTSRTESVVISYAKPLALKYFKRMKINKEQYKVVMKGIVNRYRDFPFEVLRSEGVASRIRIEVIRMLERYARR